ncbi:MAG: hypothetical protein CSA68_02665 [Rhodobacterales bacterium]|nr:MAG: hypothetical protein CSA68_02665 [Rhodobacterales bacterium]
MIRPEIQSEIDATLQAVEALRGAVLALAVNQSPEVDQKNALIALADMYAQHTNRTHWRVSYLVRGDGKFFDRLNRGGGCTLKTAQKVFQWFSDHWPDQEIEWPADIPRPTPSKKEAA